MEERYLTIQQLNTLLQNLVPALCVNASPTDLNAALLIIISLHSTQRAGSHYREWVVGLIHWVYQEYPPFMEFLPPPNLKTNNAHQEDKNEKITRFRVGRESILYHVTKMILSGRYGIKSDALFLHPKSTWMVDGEGNRCGYVDKAIGHNEFQRIFDHALLKGLNIRNRYKSGKTKAGADKYAVKYPLGGLRRSMITFYGCAGLATGEIQIRTWHTSGKMVETYTKHNLLKLERNRIDQQVLNYLYTDDGVESQSQPQSQSQSQSQSESQAAMVEGTTFGESIIGMCICTLSLYLSLFLSLFL